MALAHDQIYRSSDFRSVDLGAYTERLSAALLQSFPRRAGMAKKRPYGARG